MRAFRRRLDSARFGSRSAYRAAGCFLSERTPRSKASRERSAKNARISGEKVGMVFAGNFRGSIVDPTPGREPAEFKCFFDSVRPIDGPSGQFSGWRAIAPRANPHPMRLPAIERPRIPGAPTDVDDDRVKSSRISRADCASAGDAAKSSTRSRAGLRASSKFPEKMTAFWQGLG
jgi:hypothetical protein